MSQDHTMDLLGPENYRSAEPSIEMTKAAIHEGLRRNALGIAGGSAHPGALRPALCGIDPATH
jgi:hypothetical protein